MADALADGHAIALAHAFADALAHALADGFADALAQAFADADDRAVVTAVGLKQRTPLAMVWPKALGSGTRRVPQRGWPSRS